MTTLERNRLSQNLQSRDDIPIYLEESRNIPISRLGVAITKMAGAAIRTVAPHLLSYVYGRTLKPLVSELTQIWRSIRTLLL